MEQQPDPPGTDRKPLESLHAIAASFLALVRTRIELAVLELREEGERRKQIAILAAVAGAFIAMAALLLAFFVVVVFWDTHRILAAGGVTAIYLGIGLWALLRIQRIKREAPPPFQATLAELERDIEALKGHHE